MEGSHNIIKIEAQKYFGKIKLCVSVCVCERERERKGEETDRNDAPKSNVLTSGSPVANPKYGPD
jgi:hypothetical protein